METRFRINRNNERYYRGRLIARFIECTGWVSILVGMILFFVYLPSILIPFEVNLNYGFFKLYLSGYIYFKWIIAGIFQVLFAHLVQAYFDKASNSFGSKD